jgi:hypothetical protein
MNRRGFIGVILAASAAPAIVRAESLMALLVPKRGIVLTHPTGILAFVDLEGKIPAQVGERVALVLPDGVYFFGGALVSRDPMHRPMLREDNMRRGFLEFSEHEYIELVPNA